MFDRFYGNRHVTHVQLKYGNMKNGYAENIGTRLFSVTDFGILAVTQRENDLLSY